MPSLASLTPVLPGLAAVVGTLLVLAARARHQTLTSVAWVGWAGITGGTLANAALSAEWLGVGAGGYVTGLLGGMAGAALMTASLLATAGPGIWRDTLHPRWRANDEWRMPDPLGGARTVVRKAAEWISRRRVGAAAGVTAVVVAVILTVTGTGWLAILLLLGCAAVGMAPRGWSPVAAFFVLASVESAVVVVASQLVLTRFDLVGHATPVTVLVALTVLPLLTRAASRDAWRCAGRNLTAVDAAAVAVAATAGLTWWRFLHDLGPDAAVSQLMRLGEDNLSHLIMLGAAQESGNVLGSTADSLASAARFDGYFTGSSSWQASVGGLVGADSAPAAYLVSSAVLLTMLAGLAASAGTLVGRRRSGRLRPLAALGVLAVGVVGTRASLAMYELGFPGQLLVATFFLAALAVLVRNRSPIGSSALLVLLCVATWWTWNLAALALAVPLGVLVLQQVRQSGWIPDRVLSALLATGAALFLVAALVKRTRIVAVLDELNLEGAIFRGIPSWVAFTVVLVFPLALLVRRRTVPLAASALVLATATATLALSSWQLARVGMMTYYGYKLEYFVLALGWAIGSLTVAAFVGRYEERLPLPVRALATLLAAALAVPLVSWTGDNYRGWLAARGALGADPTTVCALRTARGLPDGEVAVASGFGEPISNYLATRAMDIGTGTTTSSVLWGPILSVPDPATWPWAALQQAVVVVEGPTATPQQTSSILDAARTAGLAATVAAHSC